MYVPVQRDLYRLWEANASSLVAESTIQQDPLTVDLTDNPITVHQDGRKWWFQLCLWINPWSSLVPRPIPSFSACNAEKLVARWKAGNGPGDEAIHEEFE